MLTDAQIETLGDEYLVGIYQQLEHDVIQSIADKLRKTSRLTETAEHMAKVMREQGYSPAQIYAAVLKELYADGLYRSQVAENTLACKRDIKESIRQAKKQALEAGDALIADAGNMAFNYDLEVWRDVGQTLRPSPQLEQIVAGLKRDMRGEIANLTRTTAFKETDGHIVDARQAYQRSVDVALVKVSTGAYSFDDAVNTAIKGMADSGLRSVSYASGRTYQLDTAARMCVRTATHTLAARITEANCQAMDTDLVIVTQHEGCRPQHADMENSVFSLSGKSKEYPDIHDPIPWDGGVGAGYGDPAGLCGPNCGHNFYAFFEGITTIPEKIPEPDPVEVDGKTYTRYEATQRQRSMERERFVP